MIRNMSESAQHIGIQQVEYDIMIDNMTATPEQKKEFTVKALEMEGFEEMPAPGIFAKQHGKAKILVDLNEKQPSAIFIIDGKRDATDDVDETLVKTNQIIVEAETGQMPSRTEADIVVTTTMHGATPEQPEKSINQETAQYIKDTESLSDDDPVKVTAEMVTVGSTQALTPTGNTLLDLLQQYVGDDVMQVFGDTGTGKSKFALEVAREAIAAGKKVYYLDTERNLTTEDIDSLKGCEYKYTPVLDEIDKIVQKLPAVDVVILDSIGFPVLTSYARLSMKQKGDALLKLIAIFGDLKIWAYRNNGVAVVTNQPESEFGKEKGHIFRPFGDKSQFACKEIWKTEFEHRSPTETKVSIKSFRSRSMGQRSKIASLKITDAGVEVIT